MTLADAGSAGVSAMLLLWSVRSASARTPWHLDDARHSAARSALSYRLLRLPNCERVRLWRMNTPASLRGSRSTSSFVRGSTQVDDFDDPCVALPDESKVVGVGDLRWVAGGLDGAWGHHGGSGAAEERAIHVAELVAAAAHRPTGPRLRGLYDAIAAEAELDYVDRMIGPLVALEADVARVHDLGGWLATTAADCEAVKVGVALLGGTRLGNDLAVVRTLGAHEEFTLFAAAALQNGLPSPDRELWTLAQVVDGWGRIQCVERLRATSDPEIRSWILRSGFRNSIMDEYLAYVAATTGDLLSALQVRVVDRELLTAAGQIIRALVAGGPAEDLDDYEDGAEAVEAFMGHMVAQAGTLDDFLAVAAVESFLSEEGSWESRSERGWNQTRRQHLREQCRAVLDRSGWDRPIAEGLCAEDPATFWQANQVARKRGIDTFELHFQKISDDPIDGPWFGAWSQADEPRARRLANLARRSIPLDEIASGTSDEIGFGPRFRPHRALDWTLQALREFPGLGGDLLLVGLQSPMTHNRNMALNALEVWPPQTWPPAARASVVHVASVDPNERIRARSRQLLDERV